MEFPDLGKHCSDTTCKQLDFLPMKCDACEKIFCTDHIFYDSHRCEAAYKKDVQVPVCPLCNKPVPGRRDESPDVRVSEHIDRDCQSDRAVKKRKVFANKCTKKGCKQKELMPVICSSCQLNFCLKHRHPQDHDCQRSGQGLSRTGTAAMNRAQVTKKPASQRPRQPQQTSMSQIGGDLARDRRQREATAGRQATMPAGMSEDEAMARAIQISLNQQQPQPQPQPSSNHQEQEEADRALAIALAESEEEARRHNQQQGTQRQQSSSKSSCTMS